MIRRGLTAPTVFDLCRTRRFHVAQDTMLFLLLRVRMTRPCSLPANVCHRASRSSPIQLPLPSGANKIYCCCINSPFPASECVTSQSCCVRQPMCENILCKEANEKICVWRSLLLPGLLFSFFTCCYPFFVWFFFRGRTLLLFFFLLLYLVLLFPQQGVLWYHARNSHFLWNRGLSRWYACVSMNQKNGEKSSQEERRIDEDFR